MDCVQEGHLLIVWMALWYVVFAALAMLGGSARQMTSCPNMARDDTNGYGDV